MIIVWLVTRKYQMKRLSSGRTSHGSFWRDADNSEDDDDDWSFSSERGTKKRKSTGDKSWTKFLTQKRQDFTPSPSPAPSSVCKSLVLISPKKAVNHQQQSSPPPHHNDNVCEFESPIKFFNDKSYDFIITRSPSPPSECKTPVFTSLKVSNHTKPRRSLHHHQEKNSHEIEEFESPNKFNKNKRQKCTTLLSSPSLPSEEAEHKIPFISVFASPIKVVNRNYPHNLQQDSNNSHNLCEIEEFESPKKKSGDDNHNNNNLNHNTEQYSEHWTIVGGKERNKRSLAKEFKAAVSGYDSSVRRFAQDYRLKKFDENVAMTLIIRHIYGREEKLFWTICRHVEDDVDRCIMFKPLYPYEIAVGVVLKLYQPWKEINVPGVPMPVIVCTDFYRIGEKRENYFNVSKELREEMKSTPVPFTSSFIKVTVDDELSCLLSSLLPFQLTNPNTVSKQMKKSLVRTSIDLDAVIYKLSLSSLTSSTSNKVAKKYLLCDSDNCFFILQLPEIDTKKKEQLQQVLKSSKYMSFKGLCIISRTTILEDARLFPIFNQGESNQNFYYTVGLRHCTKWKVEDHLDIPILYQPQEMYS